MSLTCKTFVEGDKILLLLKVNSLQETRDRCSSMLSKVTSVCIVVLTAVSKSYIYIFARPNSVAVLFVNLLPDIYRSNFSVTYLFIR